jgi:hypothetical protein
MSKLAFRAQAVDIASLPAKSLLAKKVLMTAQRDLCLGNSMYILDKRGEHIRIVLFRQRPEHLLLVRHREGKYLRRKTWWKYLKEERMRKCS